MSTPYLSHAALVVGPSAVILGLVLNHRRDDLDRLLADLPDGIARHVRATVAAIDTAADAHRTQVDARLPQTASAVADGAEAESTTEAASALQVANVTYASSLLAARSLQPRSVGDGSSTSTERT